MTTTESLRLALDNVNVKIRELETENSKLRDTHPQEAEAIDKDQDMQHLKELYEHAGSKRPPRETEGGGGSRKDGPRETEPLDPTGGAYETTREGEE